MCAYEPATHVDLKLLANVRMGRSVIGICLIAGSIVGGFIPTLWGASSFGVVSLLFSGAGAVAGVFVGARIAEM